MFKRNIQLLILGYTLAMGSTHVNAASPGLWEGTTTRPPESLRLPETDVRPGSFEFVSLSPVYFESNKAMLTFEGQQALDVASDYLQQHSDIKRILIEGHTDYKGTRRANDDLSDRRALIVRNYLTIKGIDPTLMTLSGKGEYQPVDQNWTRDGRQRNRHVSIHAVHWTHQDALVD